MLGGLWEEELARRAGNTEDLRPPVFIIVCKNTAIAKVVYEWLAEGKQPAGVAPSKIEGFLNSAGRQNTIRVDTKVVHETDTGNAKSDEVRWMRSMLDTVGKTHWPADRQGRPIYPDGFEELAQKLERPLHPPGRDVRCIVSVGMLTEGWDCNTVTHIIGLRPFMSQLLCEQVVGRGLRRTSYKDVDDNGNFREEVAKVFGVPFEVIPYKANPQGPPKEQKERRHVHAIPGKEAFRIEFPRMERYTQGIRNRIVVDWAKVPPLTLQPGQIPPEVDVKALSLTNQGRMSLSGPGRVDEVTLAEFRGNRRVQELVFDVAAAITRFYVGLPGCEVPAHKLFPQVVPVVQRYVDEKVKVIRPADKKDLFLSPYYGWLVEVVAEAIRPDTSHGEVAELPVYEEHRGPGSTDEVDFWTSRDVREVVRSHVNYVVADTQRWEQSAAYYIDHHGATAAFVKNAGLGFAVPYMHNGEMHDYVPDFIVRLNAKGSAPQYLILETKGYDTLAEVKEAAAMRWVKAVNADGRHGHWQYAVARKAEETQDRLDEAAQEKG